MTRRRKVVKPVVSKSDRLKKYILIIIQALLGVFVGLSIYIYRTSSALTVNAGVEGSSYVPSFTELSIAYDASSVFNRNFENDFGNIIRFVAIREQLEENGVYNASKKINIGEFYNKSNDAEYTGPDIYYYLDDLIKWAQRGISQDYRFFWTEKSYEDFFSGSSDTDFYVPTEEESLSTPYASFSTIVNRYTTTDGKKLEQCVSNTEEYNEMRTALIATINGLYSDYREYLQFKNYYDSDNSNFQFYVSMTDAGQKKIFTNVDQLTVNSSGEDKVGNFFKEFGKYLYTKPGKLDFLSNTGIEYDTVRQMIYTDYSYAYPDDTAIWVAVDTKYPVKDVYYTNYNSFYRTSRLIPWIVSLAAVSFVGFFGIGAWIIINEKKRLSYVGAADDLGDYDKLPLEVSLLVFVLLLLVLYFGEKILLTRLDSFVSDASLYYIPASVLLGVDLYVILSFFYGFVRRIVCHNVFEGSLVAFLKPYFSKGYHKIQKWFWKQYDSSGVAIRTWMSYVFFMLFNVFWALMMFFGEHPVVAFFVLIVFDVIIGAILFDRNLERKSIVDGIKRINDGDFDYKIDTKRMHGDNKDLADAVNNIGLGISKAVEVSVKDEKMKADLITNVSHDIKTPLTSIINYVDLLKRENIDNERVTKYIKVLDEKSQRLKQLTFDLVEASKIQSGNISIEFNRINFIELLGQTIGEFEEKFEEKKLTVVTNFPKEPVYIMADPRHMWRVIENLYNNVYKYALQDTRVYLDLTTTTEKGKPVMVMSLKNISNQALNIPAEELTERFIRGDVSRSTEGSGLGLSIAKSLTAAQNGEFNIYLDGDLFKVTLQFPIAE